MRKLIPIIWILIFITSCSSSKYLEKSNDSEDNFSKKIECSLLYNDVYSSLEEKYWIITDWIDESWEYQIENPKIYYTPKLDSCIAYTEIIKKVKSERVNLIYNLEITDILTKEIIDWIVCYMNNSWEKINWIPQYTSKDLEDFNNCTKIINTKLEELKN